MGLREHAAVVVAGDPTSIQADDQNCCQRHPDVPHEAGIRPVYTRWMKCPKVGFEFEWESGIGQTKCARAQPVPGVLWCPGRHSSV